jgi:predicted phage-related endonuclease
MAPIIIDSFEQGSTEWMIARLGTPGGSGISDIITSEGKISKSRDMYVAELAAEVVRGKPDEDNFISRHMANGKEREAASRALFELIYGVDVRQVGIVYKDKFKMCHYSPDGLIDEFDAILEAKNPMAKTHAKALDDGKLPTKYFSQCQMGLYVCERKLCYFVSCREGLRPLIIKVERDEPFISKIEKAIADFYVDLCGMVERIKAMEGMPF